MNRLHIKEELMLLLAAYRYRRSETLGVLKWYSERNLSKVRKFFFNIYKKYPFRKIRVKPFYSAF